MSKKKFMMMINMLNPWAFSCKDTERLLFDYVEGGLDPKIIEKLDKHFSDCPECIAFLETYRNTIDLVQEHGLPDLEIPARMREDHSWMSSISRNR